MYFPTYNLQNFYENPYEIVKLADSLEYYPSNGDYPGSRSDYLYNIDKDIFTYSCEKVLKMIYGPNYHNIKYNADNLFQKITYDDVKRDKGLGWVHVDAVCKLTALIYLTPGMNKSGTTIFTSKVEGKNIIDDQSRKDYYAGNHVVDDYEQRLKENNDRFLPIASFSSHFNSLVAFDGNSFHGANFDLEQGEERLTQVIFFYDIEAKYYPAPEARKPY